MVIGNNFLSLFKNILFNKLVVNCYVIVDYDLWESIANVGSYEPMTILFC